jgi:alpha-L-fucosidase
LNRGNVNGKNWIPAECDVSIRPGWFYHKEEDDRVKTPEQLFQLYLKSVGRGANLLLNVPPDPRGLINEKDSAALIAFKELRGESFKDNVLAEKAANFEGRPYNSGALISLTLDHPKQIDCIVLREQLANGQGIQYFQVNLVNDKNEKVSIKGTTIGRKRILTFPAYEVKKIYLDVQGKSSPSVPGIEAFLIDENLIEK